jgi:mannose-6-phosphate isomerase-like protein (cupin superfamily)
MIQHVQITSLAREWGTETFIAETACYLGKILRMKAGTKGGLQKHVEKVETFYLHDGKAWVRGDNGTGLFTVEMSSGTAYHIPAGTVHQVEAITDCVFFETSTPHYNDRIRCEAEYGLPEDGGLPTTK